MYVLYQRLSVMLLWLKSAHQTCIEVALQTISLRTSYYSFGNQTVKKQTWKSSKTFLAKANCYHQRTLPVFLESRLTGKKVWERWNPSRAIVKHSCVTDKQTQKFATSVEYKGPPVRSGIIFWIVHLRTLSLLIRCMESVWKRKMLSRAELNCQSVPKIQNKSKSQDHCAELRPKAARKACVRICGEFTMPRKT